VLNHSEFLDRLDAAIITGGSSAQIARKIGVNEVTVRRRKAALGQAGLLPSRREQREVSNATTNG
jgi:NADH/NAD ratio-sensing transcriptional regulator Rex